MGNNRNRMKLAAAAVLAALGGISLMSIKKASEYEFGKGIFTVSIGGRAELRNTIEIPLEEVKSLNLKYKSKNIQVYSAEDETVVIREYLISDKPEAVATVEYGAEKRVTVTGGDARTFVVFGFGMGEGERIEVYLPEKGLAELAIETGSGNITSRCRYQEKDGSLSVQAGSGNVRWDFGEAGELSFRAGSGNVKVQELKGSVTLKTGSGNITGEKVEGEIEAEAGSGQITLEEFSGGGKMTAGSGNIRVKALTLQGDMEVQTNSGNIRLELKEEPDCHFELKTGSGNISTDFDGQLSFNKKGNSAEGDVGENPIWQFRVKAGSGNVKIERRN